MLWLSLYNSFPNTNWGIVSISTIRYGSAKSWSTCAWNASSKTWFGNPTTLVPSNPPERWNLTQMRRPYIQIRFCSYLDIYSQLLHTFYLYFYQLPPIDRWVKTFHLIPIEKCWSAFNKSTLLRKKLPTTIDTIILAMCFNQVFPISNLPHDAITLGAHPCKEKMLAGRGNMLQSGFPN